MNNCAVIGYISPSSYPGTDQFIANIRQFKTKFPLLLFSHRTDVRADIILKADPATQVRGAKYPNGEDNKWAVANLIFLTTLRILRDKGIRYFLYVESDCRVWGDGWDGVVFEEFFNAGAGKLLGGSVVTYNPCNRNAKFANRWRSFLASNNESPWPIPAYGGTGAAEQHEPSVLVNGALAIYDFDFLSTIYSLDNTAAEAAATTAFDYYIGRELVRRFGEDAFDKIVQLNSIYSGYGNVMFTEEERRDLLTSGKVVAVHQIKSTWLPGGVSELDRRSRDVEKGLANSTTAESHAGSNPATPTNYFEGETHIGKTFSVLQPSVSLFIVSHKKDIEWLKFCLLSIKKYATGFLRTVVVVPTSEEKDFAFIHKVDGIRLCTFKQESSKRGHLHHMAIKCMADTFDDDASWYAYVDSDCIFTEPVTPADYFVKGKAVVLMEPYTELVNRKDGAAVWKNTVDRALATNSQYEFMRRHPEVHHRGLLREMRLLIEKLHSMRFEEYVLEQKADFPCGFCEFNTMGEYAWRFWNDRYHFIDVSKQPHPHNKLMQFWSHGPMDKPQEIWHEGKLLRGIIPKNEIIKNLSQI